MERATARRWSWMPIVFFLMGMLSATLLVFIDKINDKQDVNFVFADMIMDIQLRAATAHLWLEEIMAGETGLDIQKVREDVDHAISLADALLEGGTSDHGMALQPIQEPDLRPRIESVKSLLLDFKAMAVERYGDPVLGGIGSESDERFDSLFRQLLNDARELEYIAESRQVENKIDSNRLVISILLVWIFVVFVAAAGLWNREAKKTLAEEGLRKAKEGLELSVQERTLELSKANSHLQCEIAERKRAEENIRLYEEVVSHMPVGLYVWSREEGEDGDGLRLVAANPVAIQSSGGGTANGPGNAEAERFLSILGTDMPSLFDDVTRTGRAIELDTVCYGDTHITECFLSVKAFPLPNGCIGVMFENITDRKRAEQALRESENKFRSLSAEFRALLEAIPDSITLLSPELEMLWSNRGAAKGADCDAPGMSGEFCYAVRYGLSEPCKGCPAMMSYLTAKPESANVSASDGTCWDVRAFPIRNEGGRITRILELATDITEKMALQAETMRAAHLASIGELAAGVAHEINNPINGIINYAEILTEESSEGSRENAIANRIIKEGIRIAGIVNGLLSFARDRKEEKQVVHVEGILSDALALTESQLRKSAIALTVNIPDDLPRIEVNAQQVQQVFLNIINNARYALNQKYPDVDPNKIIEITCEEVVVDGCPHLRVTFHDRGEGISLNMIDNIMNPFFSTKPPGKGTGLGLSISHGIISDHGGKLKVTSVHGEHTTVVALLPALEKSHGHHSCDR